MTAGMTWKKKQMLELAIFCCSDAVCSFFAMQKQVPARTLYIWNSSSGFSRQKGASRYLCFSEQKSCDEISDRHSSWGLAQKHWLEMSLLGCVESLCTQEVLGVHVKCRRGFHRCFVDRYSVPSSFAKTTFHRVSDQYCCRAL